MTRLKQALNQLLTFIRNKQSVFKNTIYVTKAGTIFALASDLNVNVSNPESWRGIVRGTYIVFSCKANQKQDLMYVFPAPMFSKEFEDLIEDFLNKADTITLAPEEERISIPPEIEGYMPKAKLPVTCSTEEILKAFPDTKDPWNLPPLTHSDSWTSMLKLM
ncbi:hypothetical protein [Saccharolobus islandicus]|uniref:Uncharacterized protein n=2 Tax=Saccharolobus islandicus TaxID=43080 RepID=C3MXA4_SACI4|nr:hypothetical protein [Sulfolobus islandicus]ACP37784.1 hypothetical protein M1425_1014 [Sulfolobus islandicus M.14.25]ACP54978.1 hypothetical protein M1627_1077 [Sulfolobus islandicus M.16.27]